MKFLTLAPSESFAPLREPWSTHAAIVLLWFVLLVVASFGLELTGAFQGEFDANPDEASHMMTSLLVHDYLVSGTPLSASSYAERHYGAYPKSAFGVWPPLFHLLAGGWFVVFEPTRFSAIVLMAALLSLSAVLAWAGTYREIGVKAAMALAVSIVVCPLMGSEFGVVIVDALLVPLVLAATFSFARFLDTHSWRDSLWFGGLSALAFLTKYDALLLIFVPLLGIALTRQWSLWRSPKLWAAPAVILLVAGPWYFSQTDMVRYAADMGPEGFPTILASSRANLLGLIRFTGPLGSVLVLVGLFTRLVSNARPSANAATQAGLLFGVWAMHSLIYPLSDLRYLLPAVPALLYFFCAGLHPTARVGRRIFPVFYGVRGLAAISLLFMWVAQPHERPNRGWRELTAKLREIAPNKVLLVSGGASAEGAMVAEMALADPRRPQQPAWSVLRASKMIASSTWMGGNYRLRLETSTDVLRSLKSWRVSIVALDVETQQQPHQRLLLSSLEGPNSSWREERGFRQGIRVFVDRTPLGLSQEPIVVDMTHSLGRKFQLSKPETQVD